MNIKVHILFFFLLPAGALAAEPINDNNWQSHPEVLKIQDLYNEVNAAEKIDGLRRESRKCVRHGGSFEISGTIFKNSKGVIRKYVIAAGSGDSAGRVEYYYDANETPRFTSRTRAAYNGMEKEDRIYFDPNGKHLYSNRKQDGPVYAGSNFEDSVTNPSTHYANLCKE